MTPQVLYFDLGNVLLSFSHERMYRQMAEVVGVSPETLVRVIFGSGEAAGVLVQLETGRLTTEEYFEFVRRAVGKRPDPQRLATAVCDIFAPIDETWEIVRGLAAAGHRMAILSNTNPLHWAFVTDGRFPLVANIGQPGSPFAWAILSCEAGAMKPDRAIYDAAIERAGVAASEIFFVDDRPENVVGARAVGIDAVRYEGTMKLVDDLRVRGVPVT
jgi:FMN phosphatase YigB (HAD superfamily)